MPPISDEILDDDTASASSTEATLDVVAEKPEGETAAPAKSSVASGEEPDEGSLSVVRDVVEEGRKAASDAVSPAEGEEAGPEPGGKSTNKEPDNENFSDVPFNKHPRFQELIRERNSFKEDAGRYRNVQAFLDNSGMSADEAADGLTIMALAKTDPSAAWARMKPFVQKLLIAAGEVLPDELAQRVQKGELTQEAAFELSRSRAQVSSVETRTSFAQQQADRRQQTQLANDLVSTANSWEKDRFIKDPNFAAKQRPLKREIALLQKEEGMPNTVEGVKDQIKRAYAAVNAEFKLATPTPSRRPAVKPVTGGTVAGNVRPEPKSTLEIVRANRRVAAG